MCVCVRGGGGIAGFFKNNKLKDYCYFEVKRICNKYTFTLYGIHQIIKLIPGNVLLMIQKEI